MNTTTRLAPGYDLDPRSKTSHDVVHEVLQTVALWRERARQRRHLRSLTTVQLNDIGVSEAAARYEAAKGFWQA